MKKILITGAAGSVGFETLNQFQHKPSYSIIAFDKSFSKKQKKQLNNNTRIQLIEGDILDKKALSEITIGLNCVIHLAAVIPPKADHHPDLAERVNINGTQNIIEVIKKNSPNAFLIFSSSISIYGDRLMNPYIRVGDPLTPSEGDEYAKTKIKAEQLVKESDIDNTIFRFGAIMNPEKTKMDPLFFHMPLNTSLEIATTNDTARALINAIEQRENLQSKTFNLGGGESCRIIYRDFIDRAMKIQGFRNSEFPKSAFATKNFHCGFYEDGHQLENILHFRKETIDDFFLLLKKHRNVITWLACRLTGRFIKNNLLKASDPLLAIKNKNESLIFRFFGSKT